jgi:ribonuclease Z
MEKTLITFLGTSASIPTISRNHTSILLNYKNESILIDCGEGTQRQFKFAKLNLCKLTKILITHWHGDHILGLPGLLQTLGLQEYNKTLQIYGPKGTKRYISIIKELVNIKIPLEVHEITKKNIFETEEYEIESLPMSHTKPSNAYSFIIKEKRRLDKKKLKKLKLPNSPVLKELQQGKKIKYSGVIINPEQVSYLEKEKKITFILDTAPNKNAIIIAKNSDLLISESSFSKNDKEQAKKFKHLTSLQAAKIAKVSKSKKLILTHISNRYSNKNTILNEAKSIFKNTSISKDFQVLEI